MGKHYYNLALGPDGAFVKLYEYGIKSRLIDVLINVVDTVDTHLTRHLLCGNAEWAYKVPLGKPRYDGELLDNSLAEFFYIHYTNLNSWAYRAQEGDLKARVPITLEMALTLWPEEYEIINDMIEEREKGRSNPSAVTDDM